MAMAEVNGFFGKVDMSAQIPVEFGGTMDIPGTQTTDNLGMPILNGQATGKEASNRGGNVSSAVRAERARRGLPAWYTLSMSSTRRPTVNEHVGHLIADNLGALSGLGFETLRNRVAREAEHVDAIAQDEVVLDGVYYTHMTDVDVPLEFISDVIPHGFRVADSLDELHLPDHPTQLEL